MGIKPGQFRNDASRDLRLSGPVWGVNGPATHRVVEALGLIERFTPEKPRDGAELAFPGLEGGVRKAKTEGVLEWRFNEREGFCVERDGNGGILSRH